jgi:hemolysin activation/secretion protein
VTRLDWLIRQDLTTISLVSLGGDNGLRGYSSEHFFSYDASRLRGNVEYRTPPRRWGSIRWGLVAFYDMGLLHDGTVFEATDAGPVKLPCMPMAHAVGGGLRFVMPQASRFSYRLDLGVPLDGKGFMVSLSSESGQAVPMIPDEDAIHANDFSLGGLANQR